MARGRVPPGTVDPRSGTMPGPGPTAEGTPDRGDVSLSDRRNRTVVVQAYGNTLTKLPDTPDFFSAGGDPLATPYSETAAGNTTASTRELTVQAAGGTVPVLFGGPLPVGGFIIACKIATDGSYVYVDFALGEGPTQAIEELKLGDRNISDMPGISSEIHLGVAGDTTSTLMSQVITGYSVPEYIAHVVLKCPKPSQGTGDYNPLDLKCTWTGMRCYNPVTAVTEFTNNPAIHMHEALMNPRFGPGVDGATGFRSTDWTQMIAGCDVDIDPGAAIQKRWQMSLRCDSQNTLDAWMNVLRAHCAAVLQYNGGQWGGFLDLARSRALLDDGTTRLVLTDRGPAPNLAAEVAFSERGRDQVPTVVIVDYTDASTHYSDSSVQVPSTGPLAGQDWIEQRFSLKGILTIEMARRMATYLYNRLRLAIDVSLAPWQIGMKLLPGDRIGVDSRRLIEAADFAGTTVAGVFTANSGAVAGVEEVTVANLNVTGDGKITAQAVLYRDSTFSDAISTSGTPTPPAPPDPNEIPDNPSNLAAPYATESDMGLITFNPANSPWVDYYEILDTYGAPSNPPIVGRVDKGDPRDPITGKYSVYLPAAVHGTPSTGRALSIRVKTVTAPAAKRSVGAATSWTVGSVLTPRTKIVHGNTARFSRTAFVSSGGAAGAFTAARNGSGAITKTLDQGETHVGSFSDLGGGNWSATVSRSMEEFITGGVLPDDAIISAVYLDFYVSVAGTTGAAAPHVLATSVVEDYPWTALGGSTSLPPMGTDLASFSPIQLVDDYISASLSVTLFRPFPPPKIMFVVADNVDRVGAYVDTLNRLLTYSGVAAVPGARLRFVYTSATEEGISTGGVSLQGNPPATKQSGGIWLDRVKATTLDGTLVSDRAVTTSEGIQGGGDLTVDRNHKLDIGGLLDNPGIIPSNDYLVVWKFADNRHYKLTIDRLFYREPVYDSNGDVVTDSNGDMVYELRSLEA